MHHNIHLTHTLFNPRYPVLDPLSSSKGDGQYKALFTTKKLVQVFNKLLRLFILSKERNPEIFACVKLVNEMRRTAYAFRLTEPIFFNKAFRASDYPQSASSSISIW